MNPNVSHHTENYSLSLRPCQIQLALSTLPTSKGDAPCRQALITCAVLLFLKWSKFLPFSGVSAYPFPFASNPFPASFIRPGRIINLQDLTQMSFSLEAYADASSHQVKSPGTPFMALIMVLENNVMVSFLQCCFPKWTTSSLEHGLYLSCLPSLGCQPGQQCLAQRRSQ